MTKHKRLILTDDGERAFGRLADGIARSLEELLRKERVKKKDLAELAGVDQAVLSRVLDGSRNVEIRTVGALIGALGYVFDVVPKRIRANGVSNAGRSQPIDVTTAAASLAHLDSTRPHAPKYAIAMTRGYV